MSRVPTQSCSRQQKLRRGRLSLLQGPEGDGRCWMGRERRTQGMSQLAGAVLAAAAGRWCRDGEGGWRRQKGAPLKEGTAETQTLAPSTAREVVGCWRGLKTQGPPGPKRRPNISCVGLSGGSPIANASPSANTQLPASLASPPMCQDAVPRGGGGLSLPGLPAALSR